MKQTAVEWLAEITSKLGYVSADIYDQAKAMEKEQIIDAWDNGCEDDGIIDNAEQYYNETYGGKK